MDRDFPRLTADWWRWAMGADFPPYMVPHGRLCDIGQSGDVWFLAGTDGSFKPKRTCAVPEGKHVLLPIINMIQRGASGANCEEAERRAAVNNDRLSSAVVMIDGVPLDDATQYRVRTPGCFAFDATKPMLGSNLAAADGYWLLLPPLSPGRHTIVVGANYECECSPYGYMKQNFEYVLHVGAKSRVMDL